jgi:hypothetical protein
VDNATKSPNITFGCLGFTLTGFRAHVVGGTHDGHGLTLSVHDLADSKISNFDSVISCYKQVLGFNVPVNNLPIVKVFESKTSLNEPIEYICLGNVLLCLDLTLNIKV